MIIKEIAALAHRQVFPSSGGVPIISLAEFVRTAISEYAYQTLLLYWKEKREEGYYSLPSNLLSVSEKDVKEGKSVDVSDLKFFRAIPRDGWLLDVVDNSGVNDLCGGCSFMKSTYVRASLLCGDDSLDDGVCLYYYLSNEIHFPAGTKSRKVKIIYANVGDGVTPGEDIDEAIGALIRQRLVEIYLGKTNKNDETLNSDKNE